MGSRAVVGEENDSVQDAAPSIPNIKLIHLSSLGPEAQQNCGNGHQVVVLFNART